MKKETVVLAFIAAIIGLLATGIIFYIYESTRNVSNTTAQTNPQNQAQKPTPDNFLTISKPTDESVIGTKVVQVEGKTKADSTVILLTSADYKVVSPAPDGSFSTTINIDDGENVLEITAIAKNGAQQKVTRTVTFSTEDF